MFCFAWRGHVCLLLLYAGRRVFEMLVIHVDYKSILAFPPKDMFETITEQCYRCFSGLMIVYNVIEGILRRRNHRRESIHNSRHQKLSPSLPMISRLALICPKQRFTVSYPSIYLSIIPWRICTYLHEFTHSHFPST